MTGVPDNLDRLWTPDRLAYATGEARPAEGYDSPSGCPFCLAPTRAPEDDLVIARGETVFAVLNLYPYNPGHLMVCPYRHVADYTDLEPAETTELAEFTQAAMRVVRRVSGPHGFNLGMNQGHVAGAGIVAHLHQHVVPRWAGDTNFMPLVGRTKVLPQLLSDTRALLAKAWEEQAGEAAVPGKATRKETGTKAAGTKAAGAKAAGAKAAGTKAAGARAAGRRGPAAGSRKSAAGSGTTAAAEPAKKRAPRSPGKK